MLLILFVTMTALTLAMAACIVVAFRPQISRARTLRRFRRQLDKVEIVTAFWRACLPE